MSFGAFLGGFVLVWIGFDAKRGAQTAATLSQMRFSYFLVPMLGALAAIVLMGHYALDEVRVAQIKEQLAAKRKTG